MWPANPVRRRLRRNADQLSGLQTACRCATNAGSRRACCSTAGSRAGTNRAQYFGHRGSGDCPCRTRRRRLVWLLEIPARTSATGLGGTLVGRGQWQRQRGKNQCHGSERGGLCSSESGTGLQAEWSEPTKRRASNNRAGCTGSKFWCESGFFDHGMDPASVQSW